MSAMLRWCVVVVMVVVGLCSASLDEDYKEEVVDVGVRSERSPGVPGREFVLGSRYGRAPAPHVSPRNDKFFMGSRYGKRDSPSACGALFTARICDLLKLVRGNNPRSGPEVPLLSSSL